MRVAHTLITDYSSVYVDALYLDKRCISFSYDYEHYKDIQRGFFADFSTIFPGEICQNFTELMEAMKFSLKPMSVDEKEKYQHIKNILFKYNDSGNAERVIQKIKSLQKGCLNELSS
jgi:CDP-glycerol glycerophosphotransferase